MQFFQCFLSIQREAKKHRQSKPQRKAVNEFDAKKSPLKAKTRNEHKRKVSSERFLSFLKLQEKCSNS
jgi:hypothetical protein